MLRLRTPKDFLHSMAVPTLRRISALETQET
jgi:hypothetical protein